MIFSLDLRRARKGDCFLLHFGFKGQPGLVMIDGGPKGVYSRHLKPRLEQIRTARGLAKGEPLDVDLLMVSHVDDDHIQGFLDMTKEMIEAQAAHEPLPLRVLSFWHNGFDEIVGNDADELTAAVKDQFGAASTGGGLPGDATLDAYDQDLDEESIVASLKVLASIEQGSRLRGDAERLGFPVNPEFGGKLIVARSAGGAVDVASGLTFTVAGPMLPEITKLQKKHTDWLAERKKNAKPESSALAAYVDTSIPNLSSIVVLAEADGKRMLLTGDARGDKILEGLELNGVLKEGGMMHVDLLKVPHHGSANNLERGFFERITADHYVFSGDGEHGNPERDAMQMLLDARGDGDYTIHLTYPIGEIDTARRDDWEKEQKKEQKRREKTSGRPVRGEWSPQKHSLAAFFEEQSGMGKKVRIVLEGKAHVIDLGEPLKDGWPSLGSD